MMGSGTGCTDLNASDTGKTDVKTLARQVRACRLCVEQPEGAPLPHAPRPVVCLSTTARICVCGQAPGVRVHTSGIPFSDPSGRRLRQWMDISEEAFYDRKRVAIVPMGFCFPGHDKSGGDLPPRRECARRWHKQIFTAMAQIRLVLAIGQYAQAFHLGTRRLGTLTETVRAFDTFAQSSAKPMVLPLPHPSWRNNHWLRKNPWFELDLVPFLRIKIKEHLNPEPLQQDAR